MNRFAFAVLLLPVCGPAFAQSASEGPALDHPDAFERAFAVSTYSFDACGDSLGGRLYRRALVEKFAHCPFTPAARSRFQQRSRAEFAKNRDTMASMIEEHGGLPVQLDGMPMTCHEQQASDGYKQFRSALEQYAQGSLSAEAIITAPCDAPDIAP